MRIVLVAAVLMVVGFAGCIGDDATTGSQSEVTGDAQAPYRNAQVSTEMPSRQFEPKLVLDTEFLELEQGEVLELSFTITDLHDYEYPLTFIDWNITYNREPNPVAEGEAPDLPGTWSRTLFAEDYHVFRFSARDGQGFEANKTLVIKVGDPPDIQPVIEVEVDDGGVQVIDLVGTVETPCNGPHNAGCTAEAEECQGWLDGVNGQDCIWFEIDDPNAWGNPFTTEGPSDVDVWFYESCGHTSADSTTIYLNPLLRAHKVGASASAGHESGVIPTWTGCVVMYEWGGVLGGASGGPISMQITIETPFDGDPWVERDEDGVCHAESGVWTHPTVNNGGQHVARIYEHDRTGSMYSRSPGYAIWNSLWDGESGGTWVYQESNGIPGLQVGGESTTSGEVEAYLDCVNPDTILF